MHRSVEQPLKDLELRLDSRNAFKIKKKKSSRQKALGLCRHLVSVPDPSLKDLHSQLQVQQIEFIKSQNYDNDLKHGVIQEIKQAREAHSAHRGHSLPHTTPRYAGEKTSNGSSQQNFYNPSQGYVGMAKQQKHERDREKQEKEFFSQYHQTNHWNQKIQYQLQQQVHMQYQHQMSQLQQHIASQSRTHQYSFQQQILQRQAEKEKQKETFNEWQNNRVMIKVSSRDQMQKLAEKEKEDKQMNKEKDDSKEQKLQPYQVFQSQQMALKERILQQQKEAQAQKEAQVLAQKEQLAAARAKHQASQRQTQTQREAQQQYQQRQRQQQTRTTEYKENLRRKFVEECKKYIGVPYKKSLLDEDHPNYNAPLFLDCCALVRKAVNNLRRDFGFKLKRENQSYQFDILPISIKKEEMKPGDLIFYKADYYEPKTKKKRVHDMVHVEIFLGGNSTIGARFRKGTIQIHEHYQFVSSTYYNIRYYYKSIETWLDGVCRSFCPIHSWGEVRGAIRKRDKAQDKKQEQDQ